MADGGDDGDIGSLFKDGTLLVLREDGRMPDVPEGYAVVQGENGTLVLRKKRQRNLQKLGIGGFQVRRPWARVKDKEEDAMDNYNTAEVTLQQLKEVGGSGAPIGVTPTPPPPLDGTDAAGNKPKRKPQRRKGKNKLVETYPTYLQEAFFGRDLLVKPNASSFLSDSLNSANDSTQTARASGSDSETNEDVPILAVKDPSIIQLTKEEVADFENRHLNKSATAATVATTGAPSTVTPVAAPFIGSRAQLQPAPQRTAPAAVQPPLRSAGYSPVRQSVIPIKPEVEVEEANNEEEEEEEAQALKDILPLAGDLLDSDDLVDSIMKEGDAGVDGGVDDDEDEPSDPLDDEIQRQELKPSNLLQSQGVAPSVPPQMPVAATQRDELTDILLSEHINLETMVVVSDSVGGLPNMDSKDVEDIFKGVLTDESQESQSADGHFQMNPAVQQQIPHSSLASAAPGPSFNTNNLNMSNVPGMATPAGPAAIVRALSQQSQHGTASPGNANLQQQPPLPPPTQQLPPPCSPYLSEYSSSPGFSPAFSEPPPSPWPSSSAGGSNVSGGIGDLGSDPSDGAPATANQKNALKWEADEALGLSATISAVLFANTNHPELKRDFPGISISHIVWFIHFSVFFIHFYVRICFNAAWTDRWKQIAKIWRSLPADKKAPFLQKARENRAAVRLQKTHHQQQNQQVRWWNFAEVYYNQTLSSLICVVFRQSILLKTCSSIICMVVEVVQSVERTRLPSIRDGGLATS